ncbi:MAG: helix-turn-helix domain-containing protein [Kiritimatiellia bacterium]
MPELRQVVGSNIRHWRESVNCPLKSLAYQVGVSISVCSQWENGRRFPTFKHLIAVARVINCSVSCLFCPHFKAQLVARRYVFKFAECKKSRVAADGRIGV